MHCGEAFTDYDNYLAAYYDDPSCDGTGSGTPTWEHCGETYTDYQTYLEAYAASPSCNEA